MGIFKYRKHPSIKWKLFNSFIIFSLALLMLLWFFQTVFLEPFYKSVKASSIKSSVAAIVENINHDNLQSLIDRLSEDNDIQISIVGDNGQSLIMQTSTRSNQVQRLIPIDFSSYYQLAENNGGSYLEQYDEPQIEHYSADDEDEQDNPDTQTSFNPDQFSGHLPYFEKLPNDEMAYAILTQMNSKETVTADISSETVLVMARARLSPVASTVSTLRLQLLIVSGAMLLLSLILALLQSRRIAKPMEEINQQSQKLAAGNYGVTFTAEGYREISQLASTLNQTARDLEQVEQLRRDLIANVSHDLRTPLTMIGGYAEVMRDLPGENNEYNLQIIIDETKRLNSLVNDLLDMSHIQSGTQELDIKPLDISSMLEDMVHSYSVMTERDGYKITSEIQQDLTVSADAKRIGQVLTNLLNNAINYTGSDLNITVQATRSGNHVRVEIIDTGDGIPEDQINKIWDRYYRNEKNHKRSIVGSGLGLSIVRQILDQHQAAYGITSGPEGGSNFWFELPLVNFS
jgi:signal transduction histidine kinase